eukprot:scaffold318413_cov32-Tisochrysis_lutea.AAC.4
MSGGIWWDINYTWQIPFARAAAVFAHVTSDVVEHERVICGVPQTRWFGDGGEEIFCNSERVTALLPHLHTGRASAFQVGPNFNL